MGDEEIGKLVIKLSLDMRDLKKEVKESKDEVSGLKDAFQNSWTELQAQKDAALDYFGYIQAGLEATVGRVVEYAGQVRQFSRDIGASAEESSKLIQAADDVGVSFETLSGAMRDAIRAGVKPTMEGIGQLADQYNAIQDPIEKTRFLMEKFGGAGADLGPLMELGAEGIREAGEAAEAAGLVMDEQAVRAVREYEIALDNLGDAVDGLAMRIGNALIPPLVDAATAASTLLSWSDQVRGSLREHADDVLVTADSYAGYVQELERAANAAGYVVDQQGNLRNASREVVQENYVLEEGQYRVNRSMQLAEEDAERLKDAYQKQADEGAGAAEQANEDLKGALDRVLSSTREVTKEMLYQKVAASLDADAALALGRGLGVIDEKSYYVQTKLAELTAKYDANRDGVIDAKEATADYIRAVERLGGLVDRLHDKTITVRVNTIGLDALDDNNPGRKHGGEVGGEGYARGGSFVVPPGYPRDSYPIMVESGEGVDVTPAASMPSAMETNARLLREIRGLRADLAASNGPGLTDEGMRRIMRDTLSAVLS